MSALLEKLKGFLASLKGEKRLPKSFRKTLEQYGDATIQKIEINREPLSKLAEGMMKFITAGKWSQIRRNYDKIFHLYAVLYTNKGKLMLEKNQTPVLYPGAPSRAGDNESITIDGNGIPVAEFIQKAIQRMGLDTYLTYDGFRYNCQHFIKNHLIANGLNTPETEEFVYQDTRELIENTPTFSQWLGQKITDVAAKADTAYQELAYKRGGTVMMSHGRKSFMR